MYEEMIWEKNHPCFLKKLKEELTFGYSGIESQYQEYKRK
jgi:hypothetical protein